MNQKRKEFVLAEAEKILASPWPDLSATLYMEYFRTGNRTNYEKSYFERRHRRGLLVLAECIEYKGRFIDEIINGFWHILNEGTWCIPAHQEVRETDPLPLHTHETVDLFSAETAMVIAESYYLVKDEIEKVSPALCGHITDKVISRSIDPFIERDDWWWLSGRNNWTPWIISNITGAACYICYDKEKLSTLIYKGFGAIDNFINKYGADGGCDEGASYWGVAPGALLLFLETIFSRTGGKVNIYNEALIKEMALFIKRMHIGGHWFVNFSDGHANTSLKRAVVYRFGKRVNETSLSQLALDRSYDGNDQPTPLFYMDHCGGMTNHMLRELFWIPSDIKPLPIEYEESIWLKDLQVMVCRNKKEFFLAAKAGNNGEGHNHNDVGQFIIFNKNRPVIIDPGVGTYTRETFSSSRYDFWFMNSSGHNLPQVNGNLQEDGKEFASKNIEYKNGEAQELTFDIADCYQKKAGLHSLVRNIYFNPKSGIASIKDSIVMSEDLTKFKLSLYTPEKPIEENGKLVWKEAGVTLEIISKNVKWEIEEKKISDEMISKCWGKSLYMVNISLSSNVNVRELEYELIFRTS